MRATHTAFLRAKRARAKDEETTRRLVRELDAAEKGADVGRILRAFGWRRAFGKNGGGERKEER